MGKGNYVSPRWERPVRKKKELKLMVGYRALLALRPSRNEALGRRVTHNRPVFMKILIRSTLSSPKAAVVMSSNTAMIMNPRRLAQNESLDTRALLVRPSCQSVGATVTHRSPAHEVGASGATISELLADPKRLATEKQAAAIIGVAHRTLAKWRRKKTYPELYYLQRGRCYLRHSLPMLLRK